MNIKLLDSAADIREAFVNRFVLSWEEFRITKKDWIAKTSANYPITIQWYEQAYLWDKMHPDFLRVSMETALTFLREHSGTVLFMTEKNKEVYYQGKKHIGFVAEADAHALAARIEEEWYDSFGFTAQKLCADAFLPDDLYVFDSALKWCAAFTHDTTEGESKIDTPRKAAQSI